MVEAQVAARMMLIGWRCVDGPVRQVIRKREEGLMNKQVA